MASVPMPHRVLIDADDNPLSKSTFGIANVDDICDSMYMYDRQYPYARYRTVWGDIQGAPKKAHVYGQRLLFPIDDESEK